MGKRIQAGSGAAVLGAFFLVRTAGTTLASEGLLPPGVTPWLAMAAFATWTAWGLRRSAI